RRRVVIPVDALAVDQLRQSRRHVDEGMPVARAGLEQQHAHAGVFAQPVGEHAAGGTGTDDDVVVAGALRCGTDGHRGTVGAGARANARRGWRDAAASANVRVATAWTME